MPTSLESSHPILVPSARTSMRFSTYSSTPTERSDDSKTAELDGIGQGLQRMENKELNKQRVILSDEKQADFQKLALGAKLDRALSRRMSSQDAAPPRKRSPVSGKGDEAMSSVRESHGEKVVAVKDTVDDAEQADTADD